jgi:hypothetical protein
VKYGTAKDAANDFAGAQDSINAKFDNFKIKLGDVLDGPLKGVLDVFNNIIDDIPQLDTNLRDFAGAVEGVARAMLGPLGNVRDILADIVGLLDQTGQKGPGAHGIGVGPAKQHALQQQSDAALAAAIQRDRERNGRGS